MKPKMKIIDLNKQFELYLQRAGISHLPKNSVQYSELRRAFMGAAGQLLIIFREEIGAIEDEDEAVDTMHDMLVQVNDFWVAERNNEL